MSNIPPETGPPAGGGEPAYVPYARFGAAAYGSPEQLRALYAGYNGLSLVFLANVLLLFVISGLIGLSIESFGRTDLAVLVSYLLGFSLLALIVGTLSFFQCVKIGYGKLWPKWKVYLASGLIGVQAFLCCGIIGYAIVQQIAYSEMKRYGLKPGFMGVRKADMEQKVQQMLFIRENYQVPPQGGSFPTQAPQDPPG